MAESHPWLENKRWRDNLVTSGAKNTRWIMLGFALIWNAISSALFIQFDTLWMRIQAEPVMGFVFIFPVVGVGLIWTTWRAFVQWRHFGPAPMVLDPFPGSVGSHVGGWVDTRIAYQSGRRFKVTLTCIRSAVSGSGKNRSRSESIKWQNDGICHSERSGEGTLLRFRFDVPGGLPISDLNKRGTYHLWRVNIAADLDGPDFDRSYEIPVFATGASSDISEGTEAHAATVEAATEGVESIAEIRPVAGGIEAWFPPWQRPAQGIVTLVFGLVFTGIGIGVGQARDGGVVIPVAFTVVGSLIALYGVYYLGKALLVAVTTEGIRNRRFLFGYPITTRKLLKANFTGFEIDEGATMQSGNKSTVYYRLYAKDLGGKRFPVAERLTSRAEAELLKETFETYLGT